jgi:hypothetical protein
MQINACEPHNEFSQRRIRRNRYGDVSVFVGCDVPVKMMKGAQEQARIEQSSVSSIIRRALAEYLSRNSKAA